MSDHVPVHRSVSIVINRPAADVFAAISDITRMGEWSPECVAGRRVQPASGPEVGADERTTWRDELTGNDDTTTATESFSFPPRGMAAIRLLDTHASRSQHGQGHGEDVGSHQGVVGGLNRLR